MATILYEICTLCIIVHAWLGSVKLHVAYISSSTTICNLLFVVTPVVCLANFSTVLIQTTNGVESISFITNKNGGQGNVNSLTFYFQFRFFLESFQISLNWPRTIFSVISPHWHRTTFTFKTQNVLIFSSQIFLKTSKPEFLYFPPLPLHHKQ